MKHEVKSLGKESELSNLLLSTNTLNLLDESINQLDAKLEGSNLKPIFAGKRQGLELVNHKVSEAPKSVSGIELVRYSFIRDPDFHSYSDWRQLLTSGISDDI